MAQTRQVDPFTAVAAGQRHAAYAALARSGPVHRITTPNGMPAWLVTGHEEVRRVLADPRLVKGGLLHGPFADALAPGWRRRVSAICCIGTRPTTPGCGGWCRPRSPAAG